MKWNRLYLEMEIEFTESIRKDPIMIQLIADHRAKLGFGRFAITVGMQSTFKLMPKKN
jgi:hypothetical protein